MMETMKSDQSAQGMRLYKNIRGYNGVARETPRRTPLEPAYDGTKFDKEGYCLKHPGSRLCKPLFSGSHESNVHEHNNQEVKYMILRKICPNCGEYALRNPKLATPGWDHGYNYRKMERRKTQENAFSASKRSASIIDMQHNNEDKEISRKQDKASKNNGIVKKKSVKRGAPSGIRHSTPPTSYRGATTPKTASMTETSRSPRRASVEQVEILPPPPLAKNQPVPVRNSISVVEKYHDLYAREVTRVEVGNDNAPAFAALMLYLTELKLNKSHRLPGDRNLRRMTSSDFASRHELARAIIQHVSNNVHGGKGESVCVKDGLQRSGIMKQLHRSQWGRRW